MADSPHQFTARNSAPSRVDSTCPFASQFREVNQTRKTPEHETTLSSITLLAGACALLSLSACTTTNTTNTAYTGHAQHAQVRGGGGEIPTPFIVGRAGAKADEVGALRSRPADTADICMEGKITHELLQSKKGRIRLVGGNKTAIKQLKDLQNSIRPVRVLGVWKKGTEGGGTNCFYIEVSSAQFAHNEGTAAGLPEFSAVGIVQKHGVDTCMEGGVTHDLITARPQGMKTVWLAPADKQILQQLDRVSGTRQRVHITGPHMQGTRPDCQWVKVKSVTKQ